MKLIHKMQCENPECGACDTWEMDEDTTMFCARAMKPCPRCWNDPAMAKVVRCDGKHGDFGMPTEHHHEPHDVLRYPCSWMKTIEVAYVR